MKSHPCRVSVKAFGAVSVDERPRWHFRFAERFNSQTYLDFLKQIVRGNVRNVFLVADNVGYHKSHAVQEWIAAITARSPWPGSGHFCSMTMAA